MSHHYHSHEEPDAAAVAAAAAGEQYPAEYVTEMEVEMTLAEMGCWLTDAVISEVHRDLQEKMRRPLEEDGLFASMLDTRAEAFLADESTPVSQRAQCLTEICDRSRRYHGPSPSIPQTHSDTPRLPAHTLFTDAQVDGYINKGYDRLQTTYARIAELQDLLASDVQEPDFSNVRETRRRERELEAEERRRQAAEDSRARHEAEAEAVAEAARGLSLDDDDEGGGEEDDRLNLDDPKLLAAYYKAYGLQPVYQSLPGRLPFRHDPLLRKKMFETEWETNPPLGTKQSEQKRARLRYHIRDLITKRDVLELKLVHGDGPIPPRSHSEERPRASKKHWEY